jgi:hypothetical protein
MYNREVCLTRLISTRDGYSRFVTCGFKIRDDWYLERDKPTAVSATKTINYNEFDSVSKVVADSRNAGDEVSNAVQSVLVRWHGPVRLTYNVEAIDNEHE